MYQYDMFLALSLMYQYNIFFRGVPYLCINITCFLRGGGLYINVILLDSTYLFEELSS